jgi:hypothetical protein
VVLPSGDQPQVSRDEDEIQSMRDRESCLRSVDGFLVLMCVTGTFAHYGIAQEVLDVEHFHENQHGNRAAPPLRLPTAVARSEAAIVATCDPFASRVNR